MELVRVTQKHKKDFSETHYFRQSAKEKGYAQETFEFAENKLKDLGFTDIYLWCSEENKRARNFYENKNIYRPTETYKTQNLDGKVFNDIRFKKVIVNKDESLCFR